MDRKWKKLKHLFNLNNVSSKILTHCANPLILNIEKDIFRVFFSARDINNKSSVSFFDFNLTTLEIVTNKKVASIFEYGDSDTFYSHGVSVGTVYDIGDYKYILFMGWQIKNGQHWRGDIGRLRLENNENLTLDPITPFMGVDNEDLVSLSYPWVIFENGIYKMWYGSTISWSSENGEMIHVIKYATSNDGLNWTKKGIAIPYEIGVAQAFSRPTVIVENNEYHMWYSYRTGEAGKKYEIGYANSKDGENWTRKHDKYLLSKSEEGWDSEMVCYPCVFKYKDDIYMLYNGNEHGKSGIGIAILK